MASDKEFAIRYLKAVEQKNISFFTENNLKIMDCVEIKDTAPVSVHITNDKLPMEISGEIESMFWQS